MSLLNELRVNARLRLGVVAISAIVIAYGLLEWRDQLAVDEQAYRRLVGQLARVTSQQGQQQWLARAVQARGVRDEARARLWQNSSTGRAQAEVQDWLSQLLRQTDAKVANVKVAEGDVQLDASGTAPQLPDSLKDLKPLRARIEFNTEPPVLLALLSALNDSEHQVVVDTLTVKPTRTELGLSFWFQIREEAAVTPAKPARVGGPT